MCFHFSVDGSRVLQILTCNLRPANYTLHALSISLGCISPEAGGGGYSGFQVTGTIEWQKSKSKKSLGLQTKPPKIPRPDLTLKKSHAEFPRHKNFQKALYDITRKIETLVLNTQENPFLNQATQINTCILKSSYFNTKIIYERFRKGHH